MVKCTLFDKCPETVTVTFTDPVPLGTSTVTIVSVAEPNCTSPTLSHSRVLGRRPMTSR